MTRNAMSRTINTSDLHRALTDERLLGWGYAGERESWITRTDGERATKAQVTVIDTALVDKMRDYGFDYEMVFHFVNSKYGRWYADSTFGWGVKDRLTAERKALMMVQDFVTYYEANPAEFDVECTEI